MKFQISTLAIALIALSAYSDGVIQTVNGTTVSGGTVSSATTAAAVSGSLSNSILEMRDGPGGLYFTSYGTNKMTSFGTNAADMTTINNGTVAAVNGVVGSSFNVGGAGNGDVPVVIYRSSTARSVSSSSAQSNVVQFAVPAGSLGTNKSLVVEMNGSYLQNTATGTNFTLIFTYGATTNFFVANLVPVSANPRAWWIRCTLRNVDATNAQEFDGEMLTKEAGAATVGNGAWNFASSLSGSGGFYGTSAEDSTASKNFTFLIQLQSAASSATIFWTVKSTTAIIQ